MAKSSATTPAGGPKRYPLGRACRDRLLRSLQERAEAGEIPAIEAMIRISMAAQTPERA